MTVLSVIDRYGLGDYTKSYKDVYGRPVTFMKLDDLLDCEVKDVYINLMNGSAEITILYHDRKKYTSGRDMKELRKSKGLTQADVSELTGMNKIQISNIERGVNSMSNVTLETAIKLAKAYGVRVEDFAE